MRSDLTPWTIRGMGRATGVLIVLGLVTLGAATSIEIVLSRLQAREIPVAQDPASLNSPDEAATADMSRALPDVPSPVADTA